MRCTKAELARRLGVSRQYIDKLISHGIVKIGSDKKIDVDEAMAAIEKYRDPTKEHVRKINQKKKSGEIKIEDTKDLAYAEVKTYSEYLKARKLALEYQEKKGELISIADVQKTFFELGKLMRERLMGSVHKIKTAVADEDDPDEIAKIIEAEFEEILLELSSSAEKYGNEN
jgi:transcriptional regulator with XRE-family HTH domain